MHDDEFDLNLDNLDLTSLPALSRGPSPAPEDSPVPTVSRTIKRRRADTETMTPPPTFALSTATAKRVKIGEEDNEDEVMSDAGLELPDLEGAWWTRLEPDE